MSTVDMTNLYGLLGLLIQISLAVYAFTLSKKNKLEAIVWFVLVLFFNLLPLSILMIRVGRKRLGYILLSLYILAIIAIMTAFVLAAASN